MAALGARDLEDLAKVEVAMDTLKRTRRGAFEPAEQAFQPFLVRSDGGSRLRPRLTHALGYSGGDIPARYRFGRNTQCFRQPAVDSGRRMAKGMRLGGEVRSPGRRVNGEPPSVPAAGQEFVGHCQFAAGRASRSGLTLG